MTWAVVPAAGSGSRFDAAVPKQYQSVAGRPVLEHCLWRLAAHPAIRGIVVALGPHDAYFDAITLPSRLPVLRVAGGHQRADSVLAALQALPDSVVATDAVLVHDAARPCIDVALLDRLLCLATEPAGALVGMPCHDTLKRVDPDSPAPRSEATADRRAYWLAQTPQMFPRGTLTQALLDARAQNIAVTDEAMAVELQGLRPRLVIGSPSNRKLTVAADFAPIEAWLLSHPIPSSEAGT